MPDLDRLLRSDLSDTAAQAARPPDFSAIEQRGAHRHRTRTVLTAAVAAVLIVLATLGTSFLGGSDRTAPQPAKNPNPPTRTTSDALARHWTPLRPDTSRVTARQVQTDEADTTYGGIDIREVNSGDPSHSLSWNIKLRERPPLASALDPASRVIEHGLVFDTDRDGAADCQLGINTDAPKPGQLRVWVKNLTTGVTDERVGPPYGIPFDFAYPSERATEPSDVHIFFLSGAPTPCAFTNSADLYAYASVTVNGLVTEWDYAPDDAWLEMTN
ncbi:hypothetical protein [Pedococcus sp. P5_B7]